MKKGIVAVATIIALLMCFSLSGFAAQTKEPPAVLNGVVAYSFENATEVTYTNEGSTGTYYHGNDANIASKTDAALVDLDGGKAAKIDFLEEVNGAWLHSSCFRPGNWPAAGEPVKGWFFRVQCTGGEAWMTQLRMAFDITPGNYKDNTENVTVDTFPGMGTENSVRVFDLEGNELWEMVDIRNGYDALVMLTDGFDGYVVIDYSETVFVDNDNTAVDASKFQWTDMANKGVSWINLEWVEEGTSLTFTDYGYLTASPSAGEAPVEPSEDPAETPSEAPTETAEVSPSPAASPSPVVSPSAAASPSASPAAEDADSNIWLYVGIGAAVLIIAAVVIFIFVKKGKKKEA